MNNPYQNISKVSAAIGGYSGPHYSVQFDLINETVEYHRLDYDVENNSVKTFNKERLLFSLESLGVLNWKPIYINPEIMDGTQWNLEIDFTDGRDKFEVCGSNKFPVGWTLLCKTISLITRKPFS